MITAIAFQFDKINFTTETFIIKSIKIIISLSYVDHHTLLFKYLKIKVDVALHFQIIKLPNYQITKLSN